MGLWGYREGLSYDCGDGDGVVVQLVRVTLGLGHVAVDEHEPVDHGFVVAGKIQKYDVPLIRPCRVRHDHELLSYVQRRLHRA